MIPLRRKFRPVTPKRGGIFRVGIDIPQNTKFHLNDPTSNGLYTLLAIVIFQLRLLANLCTGSSTSFFQFTFYVMAFRHLLLPENGLFLDL